MPSRIPPAPQLEPSPVHESEPEPPRQPPALPPNIFDMVWPNERRRDAGAAARAAAAFCGPARRAPCLRFSKSRAGAAHPIPAPRPSRRVPNNVRNRRGPKLAPNRRAWSTPEPRPPSRSMPEPAARAAAAIDPQVRRDRRDGLYPVHRRLDRSPDAGRHHALLLDRRAATASRSARADADEAPRACRIVAPGPTRLHPSPPRSRRRRTSATSLSRSNRPAAPPWPASRLVRSTSMLSVVLSRRSRATHLAGSQ